MERLTSNIDFCQMHCDFGRAGGCFFEGKSHCYDNNIYNRLREYEIAEEQGLLLRLPVAIGSDVYFIPSKANYGLNILHNHEEFNKIYHQKIARLHFTESGWYAEGNLNLEYGVVDRLFVDKLYKVTWFLTKEEAEQALKQMGE